MRNYNRMEPSKKEEQTVETAEEYRELLGQRVGIKITNPASVDKLI